MLELSLEGQVTVRRELEGSESTRTKDAGTRTSLAFVALVEHGA